MSKPKIIRYVTLRLEMEKEIPNLDILVAQRAYTLDGMANAEVCDAVNDQCPPAPDIHVEAVRAKLLERSQAGIVKYGTTLERGDLNTLDWLNHVQQELMDAANYTQVLISREMQNASKS